MDVSNNRLFRWSKPEWLNNSAVRNAGVYTSGALVSFHLQSLSLRVPGLPFRNTIHLEADVILISKCTEPVLPRLLLPHRRGRLLAQRQERLQRAREIRRLDPRHLLGAGDAGDQFDREVPAACG